MISPGKARLEGRASINPMPSLHDPVRFLTGVGPEMARRLAKLEIRTIRTSCSTFRAPTGTAAWSPRSRS